LILHLLLLSNYFISGNTGAIHSAIRFVTLAERHANLDTELLQKRAHVYEGAKKRRPERWSGVTRNWQPVHVVHLNPDQRVPEKTDQKEVNLELKKTA
jgi:hypothetical protein